MSTTQENGRHDRARMFGALAAAQDDQLQKGGARAKARTRYLRTLEQGLRERVATVHVTGVGRPHVAWFALPSLALASLFVWLVFRPTAITFAVDGREGRVGAALTAGEAPLPLRFSDGSEVELLADSRPGATIRVVELGREGARVTLESGRANVHVVHRPRTRWFFSAGPYQVRVLGTRFDLTWNPDAQSLALSLAEGRVEVSGGDLPAPVVVAGGQALRVDPRAGPWRLENERGGPAPDTNATPSPAEEPRSPASIPEEARGDPGSDGRASDRRRAPKPERSIWLELAAAGKYAEAMTAAEEEGFGKICDQAALPELVSLAEAARFAKNRARSRQALLAVRTRFADDPKAQVATFLLGRLALEGLDYVEAERQFRGYLAKNPRGPLAAEVHGRLLEALEDGGHHESARGEATRYLERFPHGSYATMAKKILAR